MNMSFNDNELWLIKLSLTSRLSIIDTAIESYANLNIDIMNDNLGKKIIQERKDILALQEKLFKA